MPMYEFEDLATGESVELFFEMQAVPSIGDEITHDGRRLRRVFSRSVTATAKEFTPFRAVSQAHFHPDAPRHDKDGVPVFHSQREVNDFTARNNDDPKSVNKLAWDA